MGLFSKKDQVDGRYQVTTGQHGGKELPGVAGYKHVMKLPNKNSMPPVRFKYVRPDGRPDY